MSKYITEIHVVDCWAFKDRRVALNGRRHLVLLGAEQASWQWPCMPRTSQHATPPGPDSMLTGSGWVRGLLARKLGGSGLSAVQGSLQRRGQCHPDTRAFSACPIRRCRAACGGEVSAISSATVRRAIESRPVARLRTERGSRHWSRA